MIRWEFLESFGDNRGAQVLRRDDTAGIRVVRVFAFLNITSSAYEFTFDHVNRNVTKNKKPLREEGGFFVTEEDLTAWWL